MFSRNYVIKIYSFLGFFKSHILYYPTTLLLSNWWSFGMLTGFCLVLQILTGIWLALHYSVDPDFAFSSLQYIMRETYYGWLIRYMHMNGASMCFIVLYIHVAKGFYLRSFALNPQVWLSGILLLLLFMASAFVGYTLTWSQMGYWAAIVISNLITSIPYLGYDILYWFWGAEALLLYALKRFFVLHFILPFALFAALFIHLRCLHTRGSNSLLQLEYESYLSFWPYFVVKDILILYGLGFLYWYLVFIDPYYLNHVDSFVVANIMTTPTHIVPEWYFLPYYAMLRSFPDKIFGFLILILSLVFVGLVQFYFRQWINSLEFANEENNVYKVLSVTQKQLWQNLITLLNYWSASFNRFYSICFWLLIVNLFVLGWVGTEAVSEPFISIGMWATILHFCNLVFLGDIFLIICVVKGLSVFINQITIFLSSFLRIRWLVTRLQRNKYVYIFNSFLIQIFDILQIGIKIVWLCVQYSVVYIKSFFSVIENFEFKKIEMRQELFLALITFEQFWKKFIFSLFNFSWFFCAEQSWKETLYVLLIFIASSLILVVFTLLGIAYFTLAERKILAKLQRREGPAVTGIWGFFQPLVDGIKLFLKEVIYPSRSNLWLFWIGPVLVLACSLTNWAIISLDSNGPICDANLGIILFFVMASLNTYAIVLSAWASNSKFALLGCLRAISQYLSYEILIGFSILLVSFLAGSFNLSEIVLAQRGVFFMFPLLPVAIMFFIVVLAETGRTPFDLPEAESELVGGYHTEYSGVLFSFFLVAEYSNMLLMATMWVTLFWGGWIAPLALFSAFPPGVIFISKIIIIIFLIIFVRALLPRYRYDQLLAISWKHLLIFFFGFLILFFSFFILFDVIPVNSYLLYETTDFAEFSMEGSLINNQPLSGSKYLHHVFKKILYFDVVSRDKEINFDDLPTSVLLVDDIKENLNDTKDKTSWLLWIFE